MHVGKVWGKVLLIAAVVLLGSVPGVRAQTPARTPLAGHVPAIVSGLQPLGRLDGASRLRLSIYLPLHHPEALTNLLDQIYDPASPQYHHYLTPEGFDARFGPTTNDYAAVIAWAARNGLTVTARHPNRMLLEVSAPVTNLEHALRVTLRTYRHPTESRTFFAPDTEPSVEAGVPISFIGGLDNYSRPKPMNLRRTPIKPAAQARPQMGSGPGGNLGGFDYRAAYAPGVTLTGAGQQVGLLEFDGYYSRDIRSYERQMGLSSVPLQNVLLDNFDGIPTMGTNSGNGEVALDIEMAVSMAPGLDKVVIFEGGTNGQPNDILQAMAANPLIKQFSCSWDFGSVSSAQQSAMDVYFQKMAAQGQSFLCASGDSGAVNSMIPPEDDPYITLVGGTTLATTGPGGVRLEETAWNSGIGLGRYVTGGGVSAIYPLPSWQAGVGTAFNHGSITHRNCPDAAMVADNIFLVADNGTNEITGGTSAAAPLWAGFTALINQQMAALGGANYTIGFLNPALYRLGTGSGYTAVFDDITVGNNTNNNVTQYLAVPGYDLCTGWGSPAGGSLILALTQPDGFQITPGRGAVANGQLGGPFTVSTQTFGLTNTGKATLNWSVGCTATWLNLSGTSGTLAAGGGTNVSVSLDSAASVLPAGVYTASLWFTNQTSGQGQLRQFTLQADQELVQDGSFAADDFAYWNLSGNSSVYNDNIVAYGTNNGYSPEGNNLCFAALGEQFTLASLSQPLPTQAGQYYLLSFWLANPYISTPNQFQVQWNSNSTTANFVYNQSNLGAFDWTNLQFVVLAVTNQTTLQFAARNDVDFFNLDGVSVTPLPTQTLGVVAAMLNGVLSPAGLAPATAAQTIATNAAALPP